jgi:glycosyltransferase involved in cell wall biosynthesis
MNQMNLTYGYWKRNMDFYFKKLVQRADLALSISEAMSREYEQRYGMPFLAFHNPIDLERWQTDARSCWDRKGTFRVVYAGRVGRGTYRSVLDVARAVSSLAKAETDIRFSLHTNTPVSDAPVIEEVRALPHCEVAPPFAHSEASRFLSEADLLVMPLDFEADHYQYIRLSMPTKFSEYMASGTPVLVYSPADSALAAYARSQQCAMVVSEQKQEVLQRAIMDLYAQEGLRQKLGQAGKRMAAERHEGRQVRRQFRELFTNLCHPVNA